MPERQQSYPTLTKLVLLHRGQGGSVSVLSSRTTLCPHFVHRYVPLPGFSPVVGILHSPPRECRIALSSARTRWTPLRWRDQPALQGSPHKDALSRARLRRVSVAGRGHCRGAADLLD